MTLGNSLGDLILIVAAVGGEGSNWIGDLVEQSVSHRGIVDIQNPLHAPPPVREQERKYPARTAAPSFAAVPRRVLEPIESSMIHSPASIREVPHVDDREPATVQPRQAALPE
jgi:hypothetical protein